MSGNSKEAYNTLRALKKIQQHRSAVIKDSSVNTLTKSAAVIIWWSEYFSGINN